MDDAALPKPLIPPVYQGVSFTFESTEQLKKATAGAFPNHFYGRLGNPTVLGAEEAIARLERCDHALLFGSGMGAISALLFGLMTSGDRMAVDRRVYGNAALLFKTFAPRLGFHIDWFSSEEEAEACIGKDTKIVYFESPTNPRLDILDIARVCAAAKKYKALALFDGTLAGPIVQNPTELGVDIVVHSATKSLNGHHDVLCGVIAGPKDLIESLRITRTLLGANLDPSAAALLHRGLSTISLRVPRQNGTALKLAQSLEQWRQAGKLGLQQVLYPGLESHPQHELAGRQMRSFGHIVALDLKGGTDHARMVADELNHFKIAASLGGAESLVSLPSLTSHKGWSDEELASAQLSPGFLRLAIGFEDPEVLLSDLNQALEKAQL
ncbi:MAG: aminotransferase class I/II-fold pyridoxal phosphate-dependent enzyme [Planctomycetota bacterium]|nr:aminotransferase class I/II-fold pyridoxal phosphate-dependent enzyme [Planctomycetota bacterium]